MSYDYTSLSAAINDWADRSYDQSKLDEFIMMAEAALNRRLGTYKREITGTLSLVDGGADLPAGFVRFVAVSDWRGPLGSYEISGSRFTTTATTADTVNVTYIANLVPLSADNPTNWLIEAAPDAYLFAVKARQRAYEEDWTNAQIYGQQSDGVIDELVIQSQVAQFGRTKYVANGATP